MEYKMEIKIGIGLDNLIFGMSQDEVKSILGVPNKIIDEDYSIAFYYNDKMIKTRFDKDENLKLYSIEVVNRDARMFSQNLFGKSKEEITVLLKSRGYSKIEYEDYDTFDTLFCEEIWTTFRFEFDRLHDIEFSPLFKNDDEIIWPERV